MMLEISFGWAMVRRIVIELESPGDTRSMFRLRIDDSAIAEDLTAVQAHILVGEIFDRITVPRSPGRTAGAEKRRQSRPETPLA